MNNAAFLAELMVRRKYRKFDKIELVDSFWNLPAYKKEYQIQIRQANKLLAAYPFELLYELLEEHTWIFSLNVKKIYDLAEQKLEKQKITIEVINEEKPLSFRKK